MAVVAGKDPRIGWVLHMHKANEIAGKIVPGEWIFGPVSTFIPDLKQRWLQIDNCKMPPYEPPLFLTRDPVGLGDDWGLVHPDRAYTNLGKVVPSEYIHLERCIIQPVEDIEHRLCTGENVYGPMSG